DLIDLELDGGAVVAFLVLEGALLEGARRDDARALRQRPRHVLGGLTPDARPEEERLAVLPLVRRAVERAGRGRDGEVRHRKTVLRVPELRVRGQVSDNSDDGFASHSWFRISFRLCPCGRRSGAGWPCSG